MENKVEEVTRSEYMTVSDVGTYLNISLSNAYGLVRRKDFPSCRFGGSIRVPRAAFLSWVAQKTYLPANVA